MFIKRLHLYLLKGYMGTFMATFCVCLFIVLMQFLWRYVDDMVGKGLSMDVLLEFFYLAAMSLVPMALPLTVLLSSLMAFGNLGEKLELLAMKASGISLFRIMAPFIFFVACLAVAGLYYANGVLPMVQERLYVLTKSMAAKSPELEIPQGSFYQGIPNASVYVEHKDPKTKLLSGVMIYDFSGSYSANDDGGSSYLQDNISITCADSARINMADDQVNLVLSLWQGVTFENMKGQKGNRASESKTVPYRRETFSYKQVLVPFDNSFKTMDASITANKYVGKNLQQLTKVVDSLAVVSAELSDEHAHEFLHEHYFGRVGLHQIVNLDSIKPSPECSMQALVRASSRDVLVSSINDAINNASYNLSTADRMFGEKDYLVDRSARRHDIERHRKFTMSVACVLFFFIGAPLGAIIRKGGLGTPIVISVVIFILYYIVDNSGYKMAREGVWHVWAGIWMSSAVLLPLGVFLTYNAANDLQINLNKSAFVNLKKRVLKLFSRGGGSGQQPASLPGPGSQSNAGA